jgi:hypothetical protein
VTFLPFRCCPFSANRVIIRGNITARATRAGRSWKQTANMYSWAAALVLSIHIAWILFVICGALFTRSRPWLTLFHIASLLWGIAVEAGPWPCPLTLAENFFEARAGKTPYSGSFLVHYLDRIVYPTLPPQLITACGVAVCIANLATYAYRFWRLSQKRAK